MVRTRAYSSSMDHYVCVCVCWRLWWWQRSLEVKALRYGSWAHKFKSTSHCYKRQFFFTWHPTLPPTHPRPGKTVNWGPGWPWLGMDKNATLEVSSWDMPSKVVVAQSVLLNIPSPASKPCLVLAWCCSNYHAGRTYCQLCGQCVYTMFVFWVMTSMQMLPACRLSPSLTAACLQTPPIPTSHLTLQPVVKSSTRVTEWLGGICFCWTSPKYDQHALHYQHLHAHVHMHPHTHLQVLHHAYMCIHAHKNWQEWLLGRDEDTASLKREFSGTWDVPVGPESCFWLGQQGLCHGSPAVSICS